MRHQQRTHDSTLPLEAVRRFSDPKHQFPKFLAMAIFLAISLGIVPMALAKTSTKVSYAYEKVWPTAVRFLRIDEGLKLVEKDFENGYLLFELGEQGQVFSGSVEFIRRKDSLKRDAVELVLVIKNRPHYMENQLLDRMLEKFRSELGRPPLPSKKPKTKPKHDEEPEQPKVPEGPASPAS